MAFLAPCTALTAPAPIRVGYFDCGDYYQSQADGSIVSYDAAYLEAASEYSGLNFTYVDCGTWANAMQMLENCEIELLVTMQKNDARTERFSIINIAKLAQDDYVGAGGGNVMEDLKQIETVSDFLMSLLNHKKLFEWVPCGLMFDQDQANPERWRKTKQLNGDWFFYWDTN